MAKKPKKSNAIERTECGFCLLPWSLLRLLPTTFFGYRGFCLLHLRLLPTTFFGYCGFCLLQGGHFLDGKIDVQVPKNVLRLLPTTYCGFCLPHLRLVPTTYCGFCLPPDSPLCTRGALRIERRSFRRALAAFTSLIKSEWARRLYLMSYDPPLCPALFQALPAEDNALRLCMHQDREGDRAAVARCFAKPYQPKNGS